MLLEPPLLTPPLVLPAGEEFGGPLARPVLARGAAPRAVVVLVTMQTRAASAASLAPPAVLIGADTIASTVAVTRSQTPTGAVVLQDTSGTWSEVAANLPRYSPISRRLLIQPAGGNSIRNPRAEGLAAGTPGTAPTNWSVSTTASGITRTISAAGTENGLSYFEVRFAGTNSSGGTLQLGISAEPNTAIAAVAGEVWTASAFVKLAAGSLSGLTSTVILMRARNGAGSQISLTSTTITPTGAALGGQRVQATHTMPALTASAHAQVLLTMPAAAVIDVTLRIAGFQQEVASSANAPSLPVAATPAATVRGIDVPIWTPTAMPTRGIMLIRGAISAAAGASALGLFHMDSGADTHRIVARVAAGGTQPEALVVTSGVTLATLTPPGNLTVGGDFRALIAWSPGGVRFGTSAGGVASASVAMPPGIVRGVFGHANAAGTLPMGGEMTADLYDYWPSEAEALALLTA